MNSYQAGDFVADNTQDTVLITAVFDGEKLTTPDGKPLPRLRKNAAVTLRVALSAILDKETQKQLSEEHRIEILLPGTILLVRIDLGGAMDLFHNPNPDRDALERVERVGGGIGFFRHTVERAMDLKGWLGSRFPESFGRYNEGLMLVRIEAPLEMQWKGDKHNHLLNVRCALLEDDQPGLRASSLNHLYSSLSQIYETHRRSHTGNAFIRFMVPLDQDDKPLLHEDANSIAKLVLLKDWCDRKKRAYLKDAK